MRVIKLGLISLVFLFLLMLAISLLMPSAIAVSRVVDINAPADSVYNMVNDLSKWKLWLENYDSSGAILKTDAAGRVTQSKVNATTITIVETAPQNVKTIWQAGNGQPLSGTFNVISHDSSSQTTLHWQFNQKIKWYPWEKFAAIASDKTLGPFMEKSMENLKKLMERS